MSFEPVFTLPWWGYVLITLALTHITIVGVTLYLHRYQAHRALALHPAVSHFLRFWLWLTTAQVTREWIAVHRKHHARVETDEDPHSPQVLGINRVLWLGAFLYHKESHCQETLEKYGHGAPDDWVERHIYTPRCLWGVYALLLIELVLFGLPGVLIWAAQMAWIPFWAAGVINGIGHYWGYRNFEVGDASRNIVPWGFIIGGEELHNNHHAYASSAKFSNKPWEFDLGWTYLKIMSWLGLARINKVPPVFVLRNDKQSCDMETVKAVLGNRFQVMADYVKNVTRSVCREELHKIDPHDREQWSLLKRARFLLSREDALLSEANRRRLSQVLDINPRLRTVYSMKQRLQDIWSRSASSQKERLKALEDWCRTAEASGVESLREFSLRLRAYTLASAPA